MELDRLEQPIGVCTDPACPWAGLSDAAHFDRHNRACGKRFVRDGVEMLCSLAAGHTPPCRGLPFG